MVGKFIMDYGRCEDFFSVSDVSKCRGLIVLWHKH